jgi:hypothetical protein
MNEVFFIKIIWNLIPKPDDIWCKVLMSKYGRNTDLNLSCNSKPYEYPLWKALSGLWNDFHRHVVKQIGDGRHTNF